MVSFETKISMLEKLKGTGIKSKSEFLFLSPTDWIYAIPDLTPNEFSALSKFRASITENNIFDFLFKNEDD